MSIIDSTCNINIIGFSLTGFGDATSFGKLLQRRLQTRGWAGSVREISYGGLSVNALAGLINMASVPVMSGDIVGLELATSFFSLQKYTLDDARPLVFSIVQYFAERQDVRLFFLNLFRADLDDEDCVVRAITEASEKYGVPILDLKRSFRVRSKNGAFGTVDGIHPSEEGRALIAEEIEKAVLDDIPRVPLQFRYDGPRFIYVDFVIRFPEHNVFDYDGRGKKIQAIVVLPNQDVVIEFDQPELIAGLCFLYGPETGFLSLTIDDAIPIELITYDEHSYYRRIGYRPIDRIGTRLTIRVVDKVRDVALVRPSALRKDTRRDFICGVILKSFTV